VTDVVTEVVTLADTVIFDTNFKMYKKKENRSTKKKEKRELDTVLI